MPYKSDAQRRYFHAAEERGDISSKTVNEFDKASKGKKLPEYKNKKKKAAQDILKHMSDGGMVESPEKQTLGQAIGYPGASHPKPMPPKYMSEGGFVDYENEPDNEEFSMQEGFHEQFRDTAGDMQHQGDDLEPEEQDFADHLMKKMKMFYKGGLVSKNRK